MDFYEAVESMRKGIPVQSLVSKTIYEVNSEGLLAEGLPVSTEYMTVKEANGEWQEVEIIETMDEFDKLTEEDKSRILTDGIESYEFNESQGRGIN